MKTVLILKVKLKNFFFHFWIVWSNFLTFCFFTIFVSWGDFSLLPVRKSQQKVSRNSIKVTDILVVIKQPFLRAHVTVTHNHCFIAWVVAIMALGHISNAKYTKFNSSCHQGLQKYCIHWKIFPLFLFWWQIKIWGCLLFFNFSDN